ncbi:RING/U-box superfamily protein [Abeliophyllum distichum]|uniref:RING/U-box superfamily protein n=1 Tax=Abeliophyllum distichum TaxID=126358 RepID=A0ABD1R7T2_9LAMI
MSYQKLGRRSCSETLRVLETDIKHANAMAAAIPNAKNGTGVQMKLVYNQSARIVLFLLRWIDCSCTCFFLKYLNLVYILIYKVHTDGRPTISTRGKKATVQDFYAIIFPSLQHLHYDFVELHGTEDENIGSKSNAKTRLGGGGFANLGTERDDECRICLQPCSKVVLPDCCHAMCMKCFNAWSIRSVYCPFCRDDLTGVESEDLWVLTSKDDVVDHDIASREELLNFYLYIKSLPKDFPDPSFIMHYEHLHLQKHKNTERKVGKMYYQQLGRSSCRVTVRDLETDIQHANTMATEIPNAKNGARVQMKLVYSHLAPIVLYFLQWIDFSRTCFFPKYLNLFHILIYKVYADESPTILTQGRKATVQDFYAIILPSLQQLHYNFVELNSTEDENIGSRSNGKKRLGGGGLANLGTERDDECGICLEPCTKMVLPNCCHVMCMKCFNDWSKRSVSCPFCRGNLTSVKSKDLWVLTGNDDMVDQETVSREELLHFYLYIKSLPKDSPDPSFVMYYEDLLI